MSGVGNFPGAARAYPESAIDGVVHFCKGTRWIPSPAPLRSMQECPGCKDCSLPVEFDEAMKVDWAPYDLTRSTMAPDLDEE